MTLVIWKDLLEFYSLHLHPGYTMRKVEPAKNYDVISFGRAMNDDFGGRVKKLFDPEREAALSSLDTGNHIHLCISTMVS